MSTIHERAPGVYLIAVDHGKDPVTGKRRRKWVTFHGGKRAAKAEAARLTAEAAGGQFVEPSKLTVDAFLAQWLKAIKPTIAPKTFERYGELAKNIARLIGSVRLQELTALQIQGMLTDALDRGRLDGGPLSPRSVHHVHVMFKTALGWAVDVAEILPKNVAAKVVPPKVPKVSVPATYGMGDTARLITLLRESSIFMPVYLSARTGMRRGETAALTWGNVELERATITISASVEQLNNSIRVKSTKTEKIRVLVVDQDVIGTLRAHKAAQAATLLKLGIKQGPDTLVCSHFDGRVMHPRWISKKWAELVRASGLPARNFHHLRHAYATAMLSAGIHIKVASERLGHSTTGITLDLYSHVLPSVQQEAAGRIGEAFRLAARKIAAEGDG